MELIHDSLTQIEDGLPEVDGFVHDHSVLPHLTRHQVLAEGDCQSLFEVQLCHPLELCLLICHEINIPILTDVLYHLPEY